MMSNETQVGSPTSKETVSLQPSVSPPCSSSPEEDPPGGSSMASAPPGSERSSPERDQQPAGTAEYRGDECTPGLFPTLSAEHF